MNKYYTNDINVINDNQSLWALLEKKTCSFSDSCFSGKFTLHLGEIWGSCHKCPNLTTQTSWSNLLKCFLISLIFQGPQKWPQDVLIRDYLGLPGGAVVRNLLPAQETWVWSLDWKDPLYWEMTTCANIVAWKISWTEGPGGRQSMGSQELDMTEQLSTWKWGIKFPGSQCTLENAAVPFYRRLVNWVPHPESVLQTTQRKETTAVVTEVSCLHDHCFPYSLSHHLYLLYQWDPETRV